MNESLPCPGCTTPLPPEATGCQICMRSRTKQEIVRGYAYLREERARRKALPFKILGAILVIAVTAKLSWDNRARILAAAEAAKHYAAGKYEKFTDAKSYAPKSDAPPEPAAVNPADLPKTDPKSPFAPPPAVPDYVKRTVGSGAGTGEAGRGSSAPAEEPAPAPARKTTPPAKTDWRVSGTVYDLATLESVAGAEVVFTPEGGPQVSTVADGDGVYEADIAKASSWTVSVKSSHHRPGQIVDVDPPYRQRDEDERRAVVANLTDGDLIPAPLSPKRSASKARVDLVVVPRRWP